MVECDKSGLPQRLEAEFSLLCPQPCSDCSNLPASTYHSAYHFSIDLLLWLCYIKSFVFIGLGEYAEWQINSGMADLTPGLEGSDRRG